MLQEEEIVHELRETVARILRVPYYQQRLEKLGVTKAEDIKSLNDFQRLPLTSKEDLRLNYPFGLMAEPLEKLVRVHASSGTTGKPTVVGYTRQDVQLWAQIVN